MNAACALFLIGLLLPSLSLAQSSGTTEQQEKKRGARSTQGTETRQQNTQQETVRETVTVANEIGVGALFFPMLQAIEKRDFRPAPEMDKGCAVFKQQYIFADHPDGGMITHRGFDRDGQRKLGGLQFHSGGNVINVHTTKPMSWATDAERMYGAPAFPFTRLFCLGAYAQIVDRAVRNLLTRFNAPPVRNTYGEAVYVIPNLQQEASNALIDSARQPIDVDSIVYFGVCAVPTSEGIQNGYNDVRCGIWSFKSLGGDPTLERSGVKWLAADYVMGHRVLFAEGRSVETGTTRQISDSVSRTREQSQERSTSQGATVVKPAR